MLKAKHKTGLVFFPAFDWAIDPTHPEREERLLYTQDQVVEEGIFDIDGIVELKPDLVNVPDVQRVHFCVPDPLSVMTESHFISAGGAKTIGCAVMEKKIEKGFALVRPPGHHAMRVVHGARGFCNVNIEAIMIEHLRQTYGVKRVAIVDTDCHHGDGTQDIYWHDPDTLFISIHQDGRTLYPGSGFPNELGGPNAIGTTLNIPLPPNTSEEGFLYTIRNVVLPILEDFQPDLIVNSAGQDNHFSDPITDMSVTAQGYAAITVPDERWNNCNVKAITLLANLLARQNAVEADAQEAILIRDGKAVEGSASNLFIVSNKLLITLSDGKPDDYDTYRGAYGIEDTRMALIEAKRGGIHPFCITIDTEARDYLPHMYGAVNYTVIDEVRKLPLKVSDIYRRLTT